MSLMNLLQAFVGYGLEIPDYEVVQKYTDQIEIRKYNETMWVGAQTKTKCKVKDYDTKAPGNLFSNLFKYIGGNNDAKQKVNMTSPVMIDFDVDANTDATTDDNTDCSMAMYFLVPKQNQTNVPKPLGDDMSIKKIDNMTVAVVRFGGYAGSKQFLEQKDALVRTLGDDAKNFDCKNFITCVYDPPTKPVFRRNEVWLRKID